MKTIILTTCILLAVFPLFSQEEEILAVNVFKHVINEKGQRTAQKELFFQETYTADGLLNRTLYYDSVANIHHYSFNFYDGKKLISCESYDANHTIDSIRKYFYNVENIKTREDLYTKVDGELSFKNSSNFEKTGNSYALVSIANSRGKLIVTKSYSKSENTEKIVSKYKKKSRLDKLKSQSEIRYLTNSKIDSVIIEMNYPKTVSSSKIIYKYDSETGYKNTESWYDEAGVLIRNIEFQYNDDGSIRGFGTLDKENNFIDYQSYQYKRHTINLGNPEMYTFPEN